MTEIIYTFAISPWTPQQVTPFQGFAPGLLRVAPMLRLLLTLPADIDELTMDEADRLARRRAGQGNWIWSPINVDNLIRHGRPTALHPFLVVFSAETAVARRISAWRRELRIRPLHVSLVDTRGAITPDALTIPRLQEFCRTALRQARRTNRHVPIQEMLASINAWRPVTPRPSSLRLHSHNVTVANEMVLISAGEQRPSNEGGELNSSPEEDYILGITESVQAVRQLYDQTEDRPIYLLSPPKPDTFLLAPAMYRGVDRFIGQANFPEASVRAFRAMERQQGYTIQMEVDEADLDSVGNILSLRGAELKTQSLSVGVRAASTLACTIRLPAKVNRTAGVVNQLSRYLRHHDGNPPDIKTARVFRTVQEALRESIPQDHLALLRDTKSGVKIIADAPLEWLPVDGLPLGIRFDVSRINATPGNLLIEQLTPRAPIYLPSNSFKNYLVVSMFEDGDNIAHHIRQSLNVLPGAVGSEFTGITATANTVDEFVAAVNAYEGPILIVDSHGRHADGGVGGLIMGGQSVDVWSLEGRIKVPPIVVLSACDTHPFDRSHATVANGFLHCGATAVLATVLPIRSPAAAVFLVRLLLRAISFGNAMNGMGLSAPWTNIVGGALRMQLASDVVRGLRARGLLPAHLASEIQMSANTDINPPNEHPDWLERLGARCREAGGFDEARWKRAFDDILAASDVIRYVNIGNPEAILVADERVTQRAIDEST